MNIRLVLEQARRLEHDPRIMGEAEIARQADNEAGRERLAERIVRRHRPRRRHERRPVRDEADLVPGHAGIAQQRPLGIAADRDDGVEGAEHQAVGGAHRPRHDRTGLQQPGHHQHVRKKIVHDQRRARAPEPCRRRHRVRRHERRGDGERDVTSPKLPHQRKEGAQHEQQFGQTALHQCRLLRHPVPDSNDARLARTGLRNRQRAG